MGSGVTEGTICDYIPFLRHPAVAERSLPSPGPITGACADEHDTDAHVVYRDEGFVRNIR
jgi:hypothetical protein